jgi:choice-of-anchor A domain-containing protein
MAKTMLRTIFTSSLLSFLALNGAMHAVAEPVLLGEAGQYNGFFAKDFTAPYSDVEGRLAAGGNISISSYSVNYKNGAQLYDGTGLVAGGDLNFTNGTIHGDVHVGGNYTPTQSGNIVNGNAYHGSQPIDFANEFDYLINLSSSLSGLENNGTADLLWSTMHLNADVNSSVNVFSYTPNDMRYSDYKLQGVSQDDSLTVINVSGKDVSMSWGNFAGSDRSIEDHSNLVIYNFFEAETLELRSGFWGTILAPQADIIANSGVINGQVIGQSWSGGMQINDNPLESNYAVLDSGSDINDNVGDVGAQNPTPYLMAGALLLFAFLSARKLRLISHRNPSL